MQAGTGYAIPDVEVRAFDSEHYMLPSVTTRTDADGRFEFNTLGNGRYTLTFKTGKLCRIKNTGLTAAPTSY